MNCNYSKVNFTSKKALLSCDTHAVGRAIENILNNSEVGEEAWAEVAHLKEGYEVISVYTPVSESHIPLLVYKVINSFTNPFSDDQVPIIFNVERYDFVTNDPEKGEVEETVFVVSMDEEVITIN